MSMKFENPFAFVLLAFALSRMLFWGSGGGFDASGLDWYFQFLDVELLRNDLLRSLWHLHGQPPLFNLYLGLTLKTSPLAAWWIWTASYLVMGVLIAGLLYDSFRRMGVQPVAASALTSLYIVSPANLLFENWLFYSYPVAFLLFLSTWLLIRWTRRPDRWVLVAFFSVCALIPLTRSLFHPLWFIGILGLMLAACRSRWRAILFSASVPLFLLLGWCGKNAVLFDTFSTSSWMGMNLAKATLFRLPDETRERWIAEGLLTEISRIPPFSPVERYSAIVDSPDPMGVPALDSPRKSSGAPNYNHSVYLEISEEYLADSAAMLKRSPWTCLSGFGQALLVYFHPPQEFAHLTGNRAAIRAWEGWYDRWLGGRISPIPVDRTIEGRVSIFQSLASCSWVWLILHPAALIFGLREVRRGRRGGRGARRQNLVYAFLCWQILYIALAANLFEFGENNRFRFPADVMVLLVWGGIIAGAMHRRRSGESP